MVIWAGLTLIAKVLVNAVLYLLENEDHLFPLVRALIFAAKYVILILYQCICDGVRACNICNGIRLTVFIGNPAFGGRGAGVRRRSRRRKGRSFDATLGFPGEGWARLRFGTWNCRGLTFQRFRYCQSLGYDVLALTELWRGQHKYETKSTKFTTSSPIIIKKGPRKGQKRFPDDKAAGVGILLSSRARRKLLSFGSEGERVCYVRLEGPVCNLFLIAAYCCGYLHNH